MYCNNCGTGGGPMHVYQGLNYCSDDCIDQSKPQIDLGCGYDWEAINLEIAEGKYEGFVTRAKFGSGINADLLY